MNSNWTYKKLGEVCEIICGQDYKAVQAEKGAYPIYGTGGIMGYSSQYRCPANSIIIGRKGNINNPLFVTEPFWNVDTAFGVCPNQEILHPKFFFYFCKNYDFTRHDVSVTIPSLRRIDILKIDVPIPPLSTQSRIVSELDLIQSIIDKQKAQLKELDYLAQAIFYDMFGDPVENEKGWRTIVWKELFDTILGKMLDVKKQNPNDEHRRYLGNTNVQWCSFELSNLKTMTFSNKEIEKFSLKRGDILICEGGESGRCAVWEKEKSDILFQKAIHRARVKSPDTIEPHYIPFLMKKIRENNGLKNYVSQSTIEHLTGEKLNQLSIIVPPFSLQQSFAEKVKAIERQKELINQSIAEVQTLFDSQMEYYFGE